MKVHTESGSVYEVEPKDDGGFRLRRLVNGAPAAYNVRATEQWRDALNIVGPIVGQPMLIEWRIRGDALETTVTSAVTHILKEAN